MSKKYPITKQGKEKFESELSYLINVVQPANLEALKAARELGDLSENADYSAAKDKQSQIESEIRKLEDILDNCEVIELDGVADLVTLGRTVKVKDLTDDTTSLYTIVSSIEISSAYEDKISTESPLAKAILDHKSGDIVTVKAKVEYDIQIIDIY